MTDTFTARLEEVVATPLPEGARMDAYYFGFERTGVGIIDAILSAVAIAGKGVHSTEGWADEEFARYHSDQLTYEQRIQKAADDAAATLRSLLAEAVTQ